MLTSTCFASDDRLVIDRTAHCIRLQRVLDASPVQVFEAWTTPEQVSSWWDPAGLPLAVCEIDLRPGGEFTFTPKGRPDMPFAGTYLEVVPGERVAFEAYGAIGRVSIQEKGVRTQLLVEIQCRSAEHLEQFMKLGVDEGTSQSLDNLVAYFGARAQ